ncbi:MAG: PAS domain-containing sensor histidine kinase [Flavobacterium sp.]|nr:MAG: PAS domain-containing sensor histidine kinase [Flavobacterium sp.]
MNHQLKELQSKYQAILKSGNIAMIVVANTKGEITEWNSSAEFTFGYTAPEVLGQPLTKLLDSNEENRSIKKLYQSVRTINKNDAGEIVELNGLTKEGKRFPLELEIRKYKSGSETYYSAIMVDISRRKSLEKDLAKKSRELDLLLYRCAHDLKAPFSSAEGLINLLKEEPISSSALSLINMLETSLEKGKQLLDDLALVSIISENNRAISYIDFNKIMLDVLGSLREYDDFELVKFNLDIKTDRAFYSNPQLLTSLLKNLLQYAINYSHFDSDEHVSVINLKIRTTKTKAKIQVDYQAVTLENSETHKIFDLNQFVNDYSMSCAGLGIYVLKNIVDILQGRIKVRRNDVSTTKVKIKLPNALITTMG